MWQPTGRFGSLPRDVKQSFERLFRMTECWSAVIWSVVGRRKENAFRLEVLNEFRICCCGKVKGSYLHFLFDTHAASCFVL